MPGPQKVVFINRKKRGSTETAQTGETTKEQNHTKWSIITKKKTKYPKSYFYVFRFPFLLIT